VNPTSTFQDSCTGVIALWSNGCRPLRLVSPLQAQITVAQSLIPALLALFAPRWMAQKEFWYPDRVKLPRNPPCRPHWQWPRD